MAKREKREKEIWMKYTEVPASRTVGDIQGLLLEHGAKSMLVEYDDGGVSAIFFELEMFGRRMGYRMPCKWEAVYKKVNEMLGPRAKEKTPEEARKIAWRQTYYWMVAQFGFIDAGHVKTEQVFLSYMIMPGETTRTLFDEFEEKGFLLEHKKVEEVR
jgi:hypothetical protein